MPNMHLFGFEVGEELKIITTDPRTGNDLGIVEGTVLSVNAYWVILTDAILIMDSINYRERGITIGIKHRHIAMAFRKMVLSDDEKT